MAKRVSSRRTASRLPVSVRDLSGAQLRQLEASTERWHRRFGPHREAIAESERLTEADFKVRINTKS
jgi:hypothetical protein